MQTTPPISCVFHRIGFLAMLGFLSLLLIGPFLALVSVCLSLIVVGFALLIPFAMIGLLVWVPFHTLCRGQRIPWEKVRETTKGLVHALIVVPFTVGVHFCSGTLRFGQATADKVYRVAGIALEMLSGALLGALLMAIAAHDAPDAAFQIVMAALIGAVIGALVGTGQAKPEKDAAEVQAPVEGR
jgi:hypothetical protein